MRSIWIALSAALLGGPLAANADNIYRWVGSRGGTTYGNQPPPGARGLTLLTADGEAKTLLRPAPVERREQASVPRDPSRSAVDEATIERLARALRLRESRP